MRKGKESVRMIHRRCSGIARRQNKGMQKPNIIWVGCMFKGEEFVKTMHRQCSGIARQHNRDRQKLNIIWV